MADVSTQFEKIADKAKTATDNIKSASLGHQGETRR
jgi:hypothetical protein